MTSSHVPRRVPFAGAVRYLSVVLLALAGCGSLERTTIESLHAGWVQIEPLARQGVEASDLAPESKALRRRLIDEYSATLEEALKHVRADDEP